jgi:hypothetical protein
MYDISSDVNGNSLITSSTRAELSSNQNSKSQNNFKKLKSNDQKENNKSSGHNWWANKKDEFTQGEKNENLQKKTQSKDVFHGKKKIDYEENVPNSRSYLEEFNVKKIFF